MLRRLSRRHPAFDLHEHHDAERRVAVLAVVDRWYSPSQRWFKVEAEGGDTYIVRHDEPSGQWELAAYTSRESPGTGPSDPESSHNPPN